MYLILLGAPGAGKGTQAKLIADDLGVAHVSSGDLFRENIKNNTPLGLEAKGYMNRGELVPDATVISMIMSHLGTDACRRGALLDGFPRTIAQAEALDAALYSGFDSGIQKVIYIKVETEELLNRLSGRWICPTCGSSYHEVKNPPKVAGLCDVESTALYQREDDKRSTAENRLQVYFNQTMPLIEFYAAQNLLVEINGQQEVEDVKVDIMEVLTPLAGERSKPLVA
ncbi:MAG: adenylate kinase [Chloroflexota bacterium]|nr:adenylate kinase [Chloroflexota bacterium]